VGFEKWKRCDAAEPIFRSEIDVRKTHTSIRRMSKGFSQNALSWHLSAYVAWRIASGYGLPVKRLEAFD